jgi:hypothetical protein
VNFPGESLAFCLAALLAAAALRLAERGAGAPRRAALALAAAAGVAGLLNFGRFHHQHDRSFVNAWEQFHYQLGSKYFPELGYDGLYAASLAAQRETAPRRRESDEIRHLPTNEIVPSAGYGAFAHDVRARFGEERWRSFLADHRVYLEHTPGPFFQKIRTDHGYNPSPTWTFTARLFSAWLPAGYASLVALGLLDSLLVAAGFAAVWRSFGAGPACGWLALAGLGYGWQYVYLAAFLRLDWFAAVTFGICALARRRHALAGACFGYAAMVRVFPVLFLAGPALLAARAAWRGERPRFALGLGAGFAAAVLLGLAGGAATGRGAGVWLEFAARMGEYGEIWAMNMVGLDTILVTGPDFALASLTAGEPIWDESISLASLHAMGAPRVAAKALLAALAAAAMWRASLPASAVLGVALVFALTNPGSYYWIMWALVPLRGGRLAVPALLALQASLHAVEAAYDNGAYAQLWYALQAWAALAFLVPWLLRDWLPGRARTGSEPA